MNANRPARTRRSSALARGRTTFASTAMLLALACFALLGTGCGDDDPCQVSGSGSDASGLGGQTYVAFAPVGNTNANLVVVIRGGGSSSAAATGGILAQDVMAGPANGVLVFENGLREILDGSFDPEVVDGDPLQVQSGGGTSFVGDATSTAFSGTLTVPGVDIVSGVSGNGGQEDAPLIHLLGQWQQQTAIEVDCGTLGVFEVGCSGFSRIRRLGLNLRRDTYEACGNELRECFLSGPVFTEGSWSGLNYSEPVDFPQDFEECKLRITGTRNVRVTAESLTSTIGGTATFTNSLCLPIGTTCDIRQQMSATRCIDCWPAECDQ
jgi:hypothetical protein